MKDEAFRLLRYPPSQGRPLPRVKSLSVKGKNALRMKEKGGEDASNSDERMSSFFGERDFTLQCNGFVTVFNFPLCY